MPDPIALAVPFFFVLIGLELLWAKRRGVSVYRLTDSLTDLSCGITSQVVLLFWATTQLAIYAWVFEHARLVMLSPSWLPWVVAFIGVDFLYYWWHRFSHEVNFLWAAHVVHHQSEDYNLAVALRQSVLTSWTALPFYMPLAVVGVPPLVFAITHALSTLYQFWIHTQLVGKVRGPIDWLLNLPSHHRVHHAVNPQYLDKNYGATLVVWDRLFGTYAEEIEQPVYGLTKPLASFDPMWAQFHYWFEMGAMMRAARRPFDKVRVWFASPAWKPEGFAAPPADAGLRSAQGSGLAPGPGARPSPKYDRSISRRLGWYVALQYVVILAATFSLLMWHHAIPRRVLVLGAAAVLGALVAVGALLEGRRWAMGAELGRLTLAGVALAVFVSSGGCRRDRKPVTVHPVEGESAILPRPTGPASAGIGVTGATRTSLHTIDAAGRKRGYVLVEPLSLDAAKRYPLVFVFHGDGGDAAGFHDAFPFEKASGAEAILAYPDGIGSTWDLETTTDNREVKLVEAILEEIATRLPVDRARIYATGYSSGGFLSNVIACQRSGLLRAISSSAGGAPYKQTLTWPNGYAKCPGQAPIAMLALHGQSDYGVTLDSGRFSAEYWAYIDGCKTEEMETTGYDECRVYRGCPAGKAVGFCSVPRLGHWVWDRAAEASWTFFRTQTQ